MKVLLIGKTEADLFPFQGDSRHHMPGKAEGSEFEERVKGEWYGPLLKQSGQTLIEFAGRLCYESFDLPNPATKTNSNYVRSIVALAHESVLEHVSVTLYVEGVSRNLSHELIRHRHLSFSELSQRYVNMEEASMVVPPLWRELSEQYRNTTSIPLADDVVRTYQHNTLQALKGEGVTRKQARESARAVIPGGVETKFVVSGNLRAWRDVLKKRLSFHADAEMQLFADNVLEILYDEYPDVFADIEYEE